MRFCSSLGVSHFKLAIGPYTEETQSLMTYQKAMEIK